MIKLLLIPAAFALVSFAGFLMDNIIQVKRAYVVMPLILCIALIIVVALVSLLIGFSSLLQLVVGG
jgi:hypothetical protein